MGLSFQILKVNAAWEGPRRAGPGCWPAVNLAGVSRLRAGGLPSSPRIWGGRSVADCLGTMGPSPVGWLLGPKQWAWAGPSPAAPGLRQMPRSPLWAPWRRPLGLPCHSEEEPQRGR